MIITLGNSYSQIQGLTVDQYRSLRKELSYKIEGSYFYQDPNGGIRYLITKRGVYPSGLHKRVMRWLKASKLPHQITDLRKAPTRRLGGLKLKLPFLPYKEQVAAVDSALTRGNGTICMPTGSGKSVALALLIDRLKLKTLVIVPNLGLKEQLTASLTAYFGNLKGKVTIQNIDSSSLDKETDYDLLIIDEAHHVAASTYRKHNRKSWGNINKRYFFTATPFRGKEEELVLMQGIAGEVIYNLPYKKAVSAGMIAPIQAYYYELPKQDVSGHTWPQVYKELVVHNSYRNILISTLLKALYYAGSSALCLVKEVAHGALFSSYKFAHGENPETSRLIQWFNTGGKQLIATVGVCGEGTDTKPCEYLILAGLGKSRPALMQAFGRAFRAYPGKESGKILLFKDSSHKFTLSHFKAQCTVLKEEFGIKPLKLELTDE